MPGNIDSKEYNDYLLNSEKLHGDYLAKNNKYDFLYPELDDPKFNEKIAKRIEFYDTQYDGKIYNVKEQAEKMCNSDFELMPHQLFVRNFLSLQTPYNSLLLYHGLGTGKTCSAIGVAEEMRAFSKNIGSVSRILIVASPNVQSNFRAQLFDEKKLKLEGGVWNLNTCVGNELLKEVNPIQMQDIRKAKVISHMNALINQYYTFMGYGELANYIKKKTMVSENTGLTPKEEKSLEIQNIRKLFNNRLVIIDEVHNISAIQSNKQNKKTSAMLMHVCKYAENMRLLLLSATPMYNSYKEIVWLTNLLNIVDKRALIKEEDVFDKEGNFKESRTKEDGTVEEGGKELLTRKLTGYVSYVRGENPYTFPYRIYPELFDKENMLTEDNYPQIQMNKKEIENPIKFMPLYMNKIGNYQEKVYKFIVKNLKTRMDATIQEGEQTMPNFENMESFGYTLLNAPIQSLNMTYPHSDFNDDSIIEEDSSQEGGADEIQVSEEDDINMDENSTLVNAMLGSEGLSNIMTYKTVKSPYMLRHNFAYTTETQEKYGRIFSPDEIGKYSAKIKKICDMIKQSTGIVMIYSQYIDSGVVPMALALEEMGFARTGTANHTKSLFETSPREPIDATTMKSKNELSDDELSSFSPAKYVMITGDKYFSPNNSEDLKNVVNSDNKYGNKIKVVLITRAAAEGMDFKNIRQLHIMEPWYNSSRIEQIVGRTVRNLSHCMLPFEERNVEIYLHGTELSSNEEASDLYVYRYAENKAIQIGKITRLLKEIAVDCILNIGQTNLTLEKLTESSQGQEIQLNLSSQTKENTITYQIGDKPYTDLCDYMDTCNFVCNPNVDIKKEDLSNISYNEEFVKMNYPMIVKRIRQLFKEQSFYNREDLMKLIPAIKPYPDEHIDYTLSKFIDNKSEHLLDKYGRYGYMINKKNAYAFQPYEISDENASLYDRMIPIDEKMIRLDMELPIDKEGKVSKDKPAQMIQESQVVSFMSILKDIESELEKTKNEKKIYEELEKSLGSVDVINKRSLAIAREKYRENAQEENNWFVELGRIYTTIRDKYFISEENITKYSIHHYLDTMPLENQIIFVSKILAIKDEKEITDISKEQQSYLKEIIAYYKKHTMVVGDKTGILLADNKKSILFLFNKESMELLPGRPTDYTRFTAQMQEKFTVNNNNINKIIGFMYPFKNDIVFKIKDIDSDKNSTGANCEKLGKVDILHRIEPILRDNPYNLPNWPKYNSQHFDKFLRPGLCVFLECIIRFYNDAKTKKIWFFNSVMALSNSVIRK